MFVITRPRRGGKTTEIIEIWKSTDSFLLVFSKHEKNRIVQDYKIEPEQARNILCFDDIQYVRRQATGKSHKQPLFIDNVDLLLYRLFGTDIEGITITGKNVDFSPNNRLSQQRQNP